MLIESGGLEVVWRWIESGFANRIWWFGGGLKAVLQMESGVWRWFGGGLKAVLRIESGGLVVIWRWLEISIANIIEWFGGGLDVILKQFCELNLVVGR